MPIYCFLTSIVADEKSEGNLILFSLLVTWFFPIKIFRVFFLYHWCAKNQLDASTCETSSCISGLSRFQDGSRHWRDLLRENTCEGSRGQSSEVGRENLQIAIQIGICENERGKEGRVDWQSLWLQCGWSCGSPQGKACLLEESFIG